MNIMLDSTALMPKRGHATDAGLDLLSPVDTVVPLVVVKIDTPELVLVDKLADTERGNGGFGRTGR